ncbi:PIN domain-containing protein [Parapedobacter tibetensis]|uniref:PIN domain-containing protein n=1 Tax=Parapedobacter tibetensis TaxID=2972951 RepID=UPI00214D4818|nr:PIN domain-containing protein [Parapedobacter tibetensis]
MKKTKRFVFDTNTLVSAFLLPQSVARQALDKARETGRLMLSKSTATSRSTSV